MARQAVRLECGVCDHELVHGVACDGQFEDCPYLVELSAQQRKPEHLYVEEVAELALPGEFDAVRSDS